MIRLGGDEAPQRPLATVLEWSVERLGAVVGGCVLFSRRHEPIAWAWGSVVSGPREPDSGPARQLQRHLFPPERPSVLARRLDADPAQATVVALEPSEVGPDADRVGDLLADHGLGAPYLVVLREEGRVAGVVWLCSGRDESVARADLVRALRRIQPLLELAAVAAGSQTPSSPQLELTERGLSRRELAVARLALTGAGNAAMAARLGIAERTVKNHMSQVLAKCGVRSRTQLIALYGSGGENVDPSGEVTGTSG
ncbi:MAG: helix-turn-helix transcriptional regulator [Solirubrobacterales bacterium]